MKPKRPTNPKAGFSLVEIMVATGALSLIMGATMSLFLAAKNFAGYNEGKLLVNRDIRSFTSELSDNATYSNLFTIYRSYSERVKADQGASGDFLVLAFRDYAQPDLTRRIVGYYRDASGTQEGPVRKFDIAFDPPASGTLLSLLPSGVDTSTHKEIIELSRGLSDGRLFYNYKGRSIMVRGEILHQGSTIKRATNTYNFTITPRG